MIAIYAEKPDVGKKIAAAIDKITLSNGKTVTFETLNVYDKAVKAQQAKDGYLTINFNSEKAYVTWGYGHLCELKQAYDYDKDYKNWKNIPIPFIPSNYDVKVKDAVKKQFSVVKKIFSECRFIINATDFDREGNLIFEYLIRTAKCKKPYKRACFSSQTKEGIIEAFRNLKTSEQVRPITNAGLGRSIADWVIGSNLTVAMSLKYNNNGVLSVGRVQTPTLNMLVERDLAIKNFKPTPYYTIEALFSKTTGETYKAEHKTKKFENIDEAKEILKKILNKTGVVKSVDKKIVKKEAPSLHSLSSLQMAANSKYGFTLAKTLEIAQSLYESGFITYPRTDSQHLTEDMLPVINTVLDTLSQNPKYMSYISEHARYIDEKKYFNNNKVTSHYAIIPTKVQVSGLTDEQKKIYDLIARSVIMMIYPPAILEKTMIITNVNEEEFVSTGNIVKEIGWMKVDKISKEDLLPNLLIGEKVTGSYEMKNKMTEPPKHYTDKTLVAAMISAGKTIDDEELKKFMDSGVQGIGTEATRAAIIESLIKRGYAYRSGKNILATDKGAFLISVLPLDEIKSAELTAQWEKRLTNISLGRDNISEFIMDIEALTKKWCSKVLSESVKPNAFIEENKANITTSDLRCPVCGSQVVKKNWGWGCSGYKKGCKFGINAVIAGKKLTDNQVKTLIEKGKTGIIKSFKSKNGKSFDAQLILNEDKKAIFNFPK